MKKIVRILQILLGFVFTFSGFVKAVDPLGTYYKLIDYFNVLNIDFLAPGAMIFAIGLITVELTIGIFFIFNIAPKLTLWLATLLMVVFTPLTLFLAIKNPILDCGCFGDALILSNWQTFWKNVVFDIILILLWIWHKQLNPKTKKSTQWTLGIITVAVVLLFQAYNLAYLPVIDFRPYKVGADLKKALIEQKQAAEYKSVLVYKNKITGEVKEFDEDNIPWQDTNWVWQETKTITISKGNDSGIHDFYLYNDQHQDITDSLLNIKEPVMIIVAYNLNKTNKKGFKKVLNYAFQFTQKHYPIAYCLTGSSENEINKFSNLVTCDCLEFLSADETMLKTIIRSNPGIVILKDGKIVGKYSWRENLDKILDKEF